MIKNYLKTSIRFLKQNKVFALINALGLSIALASSFIILLYIINELSYDRFNRNKRQVYRVVNYSIEFKKTQAGTPYILATALKNEFPQVEKAARVRYLRDFKLKLKDEFINLPFLLTAISGIFISVGCEKKTPNYLPVDGDGNTYDTVVLGTQVWLTENLKTTKYNDGYPIPLAEENEFWASTGRPAYCWYQNDPEYKDTYGAIYNYYYAALMDDYLCLVGYHIPTEEEWETLIDYFNNSSSDVEESFKTIHTGFRLGDGSFKKQSYGGWWAYSPLGGFVSTDYTIGYVPANDGFSIRCVKIN